MQQIVFYQSGVGTQADFKGEVTQEAKIMRELITRTLCNRTQPTAIHIRIIRGNCWSVYRSNGLITSTMQTHYPHSEQDTGCICISRAKL